MSDCTSTNARADAEASPLPPQVSTSVVDCTDGARLAVWSYQTATSDTDLPPVLLLHGNGGSHGSFHNVVDALAQQRVCVAPDMRGQGVSTRGTTRLTYELLATDAVEVLDALGIGQCVVLGSSDGGIEALLLARDHGERVAGICTMGANLVPEGLSQQDRDGMAAEEAVYRGLAGELPAAGVQADLLRLMIDEPHIDAASLARVSCPATIMCGEFDAILPQETARIAAAIPGARLVTVPGAGHGLMRDAPEAVLAEMSALLAG